MADEAMAWIELAVTPDNDPVKTAHVFLRFGLPMVLRTDNRPEFVNAVIEELR